MNRRIAILVGSIMAAVAAGEIIVLSGLLAAERQGDRDRYQDAMSRQRRAAGKLSRTTPLPARRSGPLTFCVHGVDTLVTTTRKTLQKELLDGKRNLDVAEFQELSDLATRAERYVETANAGPALPQRMGRSRDDPAGEWRPLQPTRIECEDSEAYAKFRLDVEAPPPVADPPKTAKPATKTKKRKKRKKRPAR